MSVRASAHECVSVRKRVSECLKERECDRRNERESERESEREDESE